ncbi:MAG: 4Fe-4S binding protein [Campylobacterales bacterium]|nr:4Fe-4S binding protein [Campylobacterales bacterium]
MHRRELFGRFGSLFEAQKSSFVRPPYFSDSKSFYTHCKECQGDCAKVCEEGIITIGKDKTPSIDFNRSGCTYCDACAVACNFEVLNLDNKHWIDAIIAIEPKQCMSWSHTICFSCKEPCLEDAIIFEGLFNPTIDRSKCTNCGFCISRCPSNAIEIKRS